jgi:hypothetical protein
MTYMASGRSRTLQTSFAEPRLQRRFILGAFRPPSRIIDASSNASAFELARDGISEVFRCVTRFGEAGGLRRLPWRC